MAARAVYMGRLSFRPHPGANTPSWLPEQRVGPDFEGIVDDQGNQDHYGRAQEDWHEKFPAQSLLRRLDIGGYVQECACRCRWVHEP